MSKHSTSNITNAVGTFTFANGDVYTGEIKEGKCHGKGKMTSAKGEYAGEFDGGSRHGHGTYTFKSGAVYVGEWKRGKKHGSGSLISANGDKDYQGGWMNDKRHGRGVATRANGDVFDGDWMNGKKNGTFILKTASGERFKQVYNNGKLLSSKQIATLLNCPPTRLTPTGQAMDAFLLTDEHKRCVVCFSDFSTDTNSDEDSVKRMLPVLSKKCDHWYCHGCILSAQAERAGRNNGRVPKTIPCLGSCTTENAFSPSKPKYHRMLINLLEQSIPVVVEDSN